MEIFSVDLDPTTAPALRISIPADVNDPPLAPIGLPVVASIAEEETEPPLGMGRPLTAPGLPLNEASLVTPSETEPVALQAEREEARRPGAALRGRFGGDGCCGEPWVELALLEERVRVRVRVRVRIRVRDRDRVRV